MTRGGFWQTGPRSKTYPVIGQVDYYPRQQRNIRLSLREGAVRISYPRRTSFAKAEAFMLSRQAWIIKHLQPATRLKSGMAIGRRHQLKFSRQNHRIENGIIYAPGDDETESRRLIRLALQKEAGADLPQAVAGQVQRIGLQPAGIRIRYMTSQWGSCSAKGNICLNSALVYLSPKLIDYVIIHELCHLRHLNHSQQFWSLVGRHCPDWRALKQELKQHKIGLVV